MKPHYARLSPQMMYSDFKNLFNDSFKTELFYVVDASQRGITSEYQIV